MCKERQIDMIHVTYAQWDRHDGHLPLHVKGISIFLSQLKGMQIPLSLGEWPSPFLVGKACWSLPSL